MSLRDWVSVVERDGLTTEQNTVLDGLGRMLDDYKPPSLDRSASSVRTRGHNWNLSDAVVVQLVPVHYGSEDFDEEGLQIAVAPDSAIIAWITTHEHVYRKDGRPERPWTTIVVDISASIIRSCY